MDKRLKIAHTVCDVDLRKDYGKDPEPIANAVPANYTCANVSAVKNDLWGTDWLFVAMALVESFLLRRGWRKSEDNDLSQSEYHMLEAVYEIDATVHPNKWGLSPNEFGYFGNRQYALAYLTRGDGTVAALSDPNILHPTARERTVTDGKPRQYLVTDALFTENPIVFPDPVHQFVLKRNLLMHGPASVKMYYDPAYLTQNGSQRCYFCPDRQIEPSPELQELIYHTVAIVGWDDDFDKAGFRHTPSENGAFKVMDGNGRDREGADIFWVSYEDVEFGRDAFFLRDMRRDFFEKVRTVYQYDLFGCGTGFPKGDSLATHVSGTCVFSRRKSDAEYLESVSWYVLSRARCNVYLRQGSNPEQRLNELPLEILECGYRTLFLQSPVKLTEERFSIRVEFESLDGRTPVFVPLELADKRTVNLKLERGSCMIDGRDVADVNREKNLRLGHVCIKAVVTADSEEARTLNKAFGAVRFPTGDHGISARLKTFDSGVKCDWSRLEAGSEGDLEKFRYYGVEEGCVWVNDTNVARRMVLTLSLERGAYRLHKLMQATLSAYGDLKVEHGTFDGDNVWCLLSGSFPADGVRFRLISTSMDDPSEKMVSTIDDKTVLRDGKWEVREFALVDSRKFSDKTINVRVTAEFLSASDKEEVIARGESDTIAVPLPVKTDDQAAEVISTAGLIAVITAACIAVPSILLLKDVVCSKETLQAAGAWIGRTRGCIRMEQIFNGLKNKIVCRNQAYRLLDELNGTMTDTSFSVEYKPHADASGNAGAEEPSCLSFIKTISSTGYVHDCTFEVIVDPGFDFENCIVAIAGHNEGRIENCTVTIRAGQRMKRIAGVAMTNAGTIRNCTIKGAFEAGTACGIALTNRGRIEGCTVEAELKGGRVSGVCDELSAGTITDTLFRGRISGGVCGGIAARVTGGTVTACTYAGAIDCATGNCGGIAAEITGGAVRRCCSSGTIAASGGDCGGMADVAGGGTVARCHVRSRIVGPAVNAGGIAGEIAGGSVEDCYAVGAVSGSGRTGGIAGNIASGGRVERCYSVMSVEGSAGIASGIAGVAADCRVKACVAANPYVSAGEIYRTAKIRPDASCIAMREMLHAPGRTFPDTGERLLGIRQLCDPAVLTDSGWDATSVWDMTDPSQLPKLRDVSANPDIRHPYITIDRRTENGRYLFGKDETVCFGGFRNPLVTGVRWRWEDLPYRNAVSNGDRWQVVIGTLVPGDITVTLCATTSQGEVEFKLPVTVR